MSASQSFPLGLAESEDDRQKRRDFDPNPGLTLYNSIKLSRGRFAKAIVPEFSLWRWSRAVALTLSEAAVLV